MSSRRVFKPSGGFFRLHIPAKNADHDLGFLGGLTIVSYANGTGDLGVSVVVGPGIIIN